MLYFAPAINYYNHLYNEYNLVFHIKYHQDIIV